MGCCLFVYYREPSSKRSKAVSRGASLASLLPPVKNTPLKRIGLRLQASKRRDSKLWSETFDVRLGATQTLSPKEIKRQEAIFELAQGEQDLVEDLKLAKK
ncbi:Rho guanine nucleotide exchange factor 3, partial [Oryzias melastigma]